MQDDNIKKTIKITWDNPSQNSSPYENSQQDLQEEQFKNDLTQSISNISNDIINKFENSNYTRNLKNKLNDITNKITNNNYKSELNKTNSNLENINNNINKNSKNNEVLIKKLIKDIENIIKSENSKEQKIKDIINKLSNIDDNLKQVNNIDKTLSNQSSKLDNVLSYTEELINNINNFNKSNKNGLEQITDNTQETNIEIENLQLIIGQLYKLMSNDNKEFKDKVNTLIKNENELKENINDKLSKIDLDVNNNSDDLNISLKDLNSSFKSSIQELNNNIQTNVKNIISEMSKNNILKLLNENNIKLLDSVDKIKNEPIESNIKFDSSNIVNEIDVLNDKLQNEISNNMEMSSELINKMTSNLISKIDNETQSTISDITQQFQSTNMLNQNKILNELEESKKQKDLKLNINFDSNLLKDNINDLFEEIKSKLNIDLNIDDFLNNFKRDMSDTINNINQSFQNLDIDNLPNDNKLIDKIDNVFSEYSNGFKTDTLINKLDFLGKQIESNREMNIPENTIKDFFNSIKNDFDNLNKELVQNINNETIDQISKLEIKNDTPNYMDKFNDLKNTINNISTEVNLLPNYSNDLEQIKNGIEKINKLNVNNTNTDYTNILNNIKNELDTINLPEIDIPNYLNELETISNKLNQLNVNGNNINYLDSLNSIKNELNKIEIPQDNQQNNILIDIKDRIDNIIIPENKDYSNELKQIKTDIEKLNSLPNIDFPEIDIPNYSNELENINNKLNQLNVRDNNINYLDSLDSIKNELNKIEIPQDNQQNNILIDIKDIIDNIRIPENKDYSNELMKINKSINELKDSLNINLKLHVPKNQFKIPNLKQNINNNVITKEPEEDNIQTENLLNNISYPIQEQLKNINSKIDNKEQVNIDSNMLDEIIPNDFNTFMNSFQSFLSDNKEQYNLTDRKIKGLRNDVYQDFYNENDRYNEFRDTIKNELNDRESIPLNELTDRLLSKLQLDDKIGELNSNILKIEKNTEELLNSNKDNIKIKKEQTDEQNKYYDKMSKKEIESINKLNEINQGQEKQLNIQQEQNENQKSLFKEYFNTILEDYSRQKGFEETFGLFGKTIKDSLVLTKDQIKNSFTSLFKRKTDTTEIQKEQEKQNTPTQKNIKLNISVKDKRNDLNENNLTRDTVEQPIETNINLDDVIDNESQMNNNNLNEIKSQLNPISNYFKQSDELQTQQIDNDNIDTENEFQENLLTNVNEINDKLIPINKYFELQLDSYYEEQSRKIQKDEDTQLTSEQMLQVMNKSNDSMLGNLGENLGGWQIFSTVLSKLGGFMGTVGSFASKLQPIQTPILNIQTYVTGGVLQQSMQTQIINGLKEQEITSKQIPTTYEERLKYLEQQKDKESKETQQDIQDMLDIERENQEQFYNELMDKTYTFFDNQGKPLGEFLDTQLSYKYLQSDEVMKQQTGVEEQRWKKKQSEKELQQYESDEDFKQKKQSEFKKQQSIKLYEEYQSEMGKNIDQSGLYYLQEQLKGSPFYSKNKENKYIIDSILSYNVNDFGNDDMMKIMSSLSGELGIDKSYEQMNIFYDFLEGQLSSGTYLKSIDLSLEEFNKQVQELEQQRTNIPEFEGLDFKIDTKYITDTGEFKGISEDLSELKNEIDKENYDIIKSTYEKRKEIYLQTVKEYEKNLNEGLITQEEYQDKLKEQEKGLYNDLENLYNTYNPEDEIDNVIQKQNEPIEEQPIEEEPKTDDIPVDEPDLSEPKINIEDTKPKGVVTKPKQKDNINETEDIQYKENVVPIDDGKINVTTTDEYQQFINEMKQLQEEYKQYREQPKDIQDETYTEFRQKLMDKYDQVMSDYDTILNKVFSSDKIDEIKQSRDYELLQKWNPRVEQKYEDFNIDNLPNKFDEILTNNEDQMSKDFEMLGNEMSNLNDSIIGLNNDLKQQNIKNVELLDNQMFGLNDNKVDIIDQDKKMTDDFKNNPTEIPTPNINIDTTDQVEVLKQLNANMQQSVEILNKISNSEGIKKSSQIDINNNEYNNQQNLDNTMNYNNLNQNNKDIVESGYKGQ